MSPALTSFLTAAGNAPWPGELRTSTWSAGDITWLQTARKGGNCGGRNNVAGLHLLEPIQGPGATGKAKEGSAPACPTQLRDTRVDPLATRTSTRLQAKEHAASELALREAWSPVPNWVPFFKVLLLEFF